ncbi:hypothetical protein E2C01_010179 [Portunus trituberculatus]|uniref:Uncharacterized protein n=1 Tax=Portunus trituberculatus TaxID=210409 RepID=A0A5B7D7P3_PORTR|nr:hypothetical protein [Portunus trituberculatus]
MADSDVKGSEMPENRWESLENSWKRMENLVDELAHEVNLQLDKMVQETIAQMDNIISEAAARQERKRRREINAAMVRQDM